MSKSQNRRKGSPWYPWILPFLTTVLVMGCYAPHKNPFLPGLGLKGFEPGSPLTVYNRENLFDYIDGEADVYLPLGFRLLYTQSYRKQETDALMVVDAYDMGSSEGAQRVFDRYTEEGGSKIQGFGESAWTDEWALLFRRGRYFVRITPHPSPESEVKPGPQDMLELGRQMDGALERSVDI